MFMLVLNFLLAIIVEAYMGPYSPPVPASAIRTPYEMPGMLLRIRFGMLLRSLSGIALHNCCTVLRSRYAIPGTERAYRATSLLCYARGAEGGGDLRGGGGVSHRSQTMSPHPKPVSYTHLTLPTICSV
eukprot:2875839-Rhodomonas_salina.1